MTPTSKVMLGVGVVGGAIFLLWRFWPKKEEVYHPPQEEYVPGSSVGQELAPGPDKTPGTATLMPICPPGTAMDPATGQCYQPPVY